MLRAEVYQGRRSHGWYYTIYDTSNETKSLAGGHLPSDAWADALATACGRLREMSFQRRVDETLAALAAGTTVHRHTMGLPPEPLRWEGDDA